MGSEGHIVEGDGASRKVAKAQSFSLHLLSFAALRLCVKQSSAPDPERPDAPDAGGFDGAGGGRGSGQGALAHAPLQAPHRDAAPAHHAARWSFCWCQFAHVSAPPLRGKSVPEKVKTTKTRGENN